MDKGIKFDDKKNRLDLVPVSAIEAIGRALTHGAEKYDERNWEKGIEYGRLYGATLRHLLDWWNGSEEDDDSGLHPLDHAICDIAMLIEMRNIHPELDDRPVKDLTEEEKDKVKEKWRKLNEAGFKDYKDQFKQPWADAEKVDPVEENGNRVSEEEAATFAGAKKIRTNFGTLIVHTPYEQSEKGSENEEKV